MAMQIRYMGKNKFSETIISEIIYIQYIFTYNYYK